MKRRWARLISGGGSIRSRSLAASTISNGMVRSAASSGARFEIAFSAVRNCSLKRALGDVAGAVVGVGPPGPSPELPSSSPPQETSRAAKSASRTRARADTSADGTVRARRRVPREPAWRAAASLGAPRCRAVASAFRIRVRVSDRADEWAAGAAPAGGSGRLAGDRVEQLRRDPGLERGGRQQHRHCQRDRHEGGGEEVLPVVAGTSERPRPLPGGVGSVATESGSGERDRGE
jgi:hypothetical protein